MQKIQASEAVPELQQRMLRPGAFLGGAHPKALINIDSRAWLVKFSEGEELDTPLI